MRFVFSLAEALDLPVSTIGGKATNLARLVHRTGVRVPPALVLSAEAFLDFVLATLTPREAGRLLARYDEHEDRAPLFARLAHAPFPAALRREILARTPRDRVLIARSSGTMEDAHETSLAGHYESVVVRSDPDEILLGIKTCWLAGLRVYLDQLRDRTVTHRARHPLEPAARSLAVVIQEIVDAEKSGVLFTRSPLHVGRGLVAANWGTCHSVVDGKMKSDLFVLDGTRQVSSSIASKFEMTILWPGPEKPLPGLPIDSRAGRTRLHFPYGEHLWSAAVPEDRRDVPVLGEREIESVAGAAEQIREALGYEVDMEWSFHRSKLYVLQSRPITTDTAERVDTERPGAYAIAAPGVARGPIRVVTSLDDLPRVERGDVAAVAGTDPDYMPMFHRVAAIIAEDGSPLSHTAIVARELGIPCLIGVEGATRGLFTEGERVLVDARRGTIARSRQRAPRQTPSPRRRTEGPLVHLDPLTRMAPLPARPEVRASEVLHAYLWETGFRDPDPERVCAWLTRRARRLGLPTLRVRWDVSDDANAALERSPQVLALRAALEEGA